jgi:hypothetical protein
MGNNIIVTLFDSVEAIAVGFTFWAIVFILFTIYIWRNDMIQYEKCFKQIAVPMATISITGMVYLNTAAKKAYPELAEANFFTVWFEEKKIGLMITNKANKHGLKVFHKGGLQVCLASFLLMHDLAQYNKRRYCISRNEDGMFIIHLSEEIPSNEAHRLHETNV